MDVSKAYEYREKSKTRQQRGISSQDAILRMVVYIDLAVEEDHRPCHRIRGRNDEPSENFSVQIEYIQWVKWLLRRTLINSVSA